MAGFVGAGYVPVIHRGYLDFLRRLSESGVMEFVVFGRELLSRFDWARKDIRSLSPEEAVSIIRSLGLFSSVSVGDSFSNEIDVVHLLPDEEVSREVASIFALRAEFLPVFLRWESVKVLSDISPSCPATSDDRFVKAMGNAEAIAAFSSDWWRRVGAALLAGSGELIVARNRHLPSEHTPYHLGDPRMFFKRGVAIEMTTAVHAEAAVISEAARRGIATAGASVCVTTYPCPACAKLIAASGIKTLVFRDGYSVLDAESVLEDAGVAVFQLDFSS